ncbi:MAG: DUF6110 family protein [Lachnospiraceae bacterium]|nr:DUF6110 family protein [Lachnospiraceae bacterium]
MNWKKLCTFAGGVLFGTAGVAILSSKDAKNVYTHCTAAVLRGKDSVMKTAATVKENCGDIHEDAVDINEKRYEAKRKQEYEKAKAIIESYEKKEAE